MTEVRKWRVKFTYMWPGEQLKKGLTIPKVWFTKKEPTTCCPTVRLDDVAGAVSRCDIAHCE